MAKLLFITTKQTWGGSEQLWCDAAMCAIASGHTVSLVMPGADKLHPKIEELGHRGASLFFRPPRVKPTIPYRLEWKVLGIKQPETKWWRDRFAGNLDAVCVSQGGTYCSLSPPGLLEWLVGQPVPYSLICHSNRIHVRPPESYRPCLRALFQKAAMVGFVAEDNRRSAERYLATDLPRSVVLQNPVNLDDLSPVAWQEYRGVATIAVIARLDTYDKGQDLLIDALAGPDWKERDFRITFFGTGPDHDYLDDLIRFRGLADKVRLAGFEADIRKIWAEYQLLVLPSLSEGTPLSLIEAQLCGRPALVTRVDGNPDWIEDGVTGFIAEAPTVGHLRLALERAWQARDRWQEMGRAAREYCLAKRDPDPAGTLLNLLLSSCG